MAAAAAAPQGMLSAPQPQDGQTHRGIPAAIFIEDMENFMRNETSADSALKRMQELYSKYKFMDTRLAQQKGGLLLKIPEIQKAVDAVQFLIAQRTEGTAALTTNFELANNIWATATIPQTNSVLLWLGANVMLEYPIEEAEALLTSNLTNAKTNLLVLEDDLAYLRDQITITEVNIARIFNHDVKTRRALKAQQSSGVAV
eukprot:gnl/Hemi2/28283_TR9346_c0_g1_i1.p2 gnl/Hemi2/28283_TR9346_c0_g1~~gnl/Hemi2/28283_TR9346_c0_g1_i1.p2  ORF type:complete len:212 (+),score=77.44 gnl/Hemi2/28283_TR9346_c0_g1_i1:34-636(+)